MLRRTRRKALAALATAATVAALAAVPSGAEVPEPVAWPASADLAPELEATAHGLRLFGADRFQTNLAAAVTLRGSGGYPFTTPDPSFGGQATLADSDGWWGPAACPFAVLVVASDSVADTLAAASLSDPTDGSNEPYLQRVAAADPFFDPVGGFTRVDTELAPVLVTAPARSGAEGLSLTTRTAARDLAAGGCTTADNAIIVGGPEAVPVAAEEELIGLGYRQVFRVAGSDRYATAAAIARALGTDTTTTTACVDPIADDGSAALGFYANAVVEWRTSATTCQLLTRTVVLADGLTGADALAAGWWTSRWQVPVLLTGPGGMLPAASRQALQELAIDNLIVLGGTSRIPAATVAEAEALASATARRVAGNDRYATSVEMARRFGGWYATADGGDFAASKVCLAASSGEGPTAVGWPDALAAGPWCAAAAGVAAPPRALAPTNGRDPKTVAAAYAAHEAMPVLLTPVASPLLAPDVASMLVEAFDPTTVWCSSAETSPECVAPGFAVVFGGPAVVGEAAFGQISSLVSGQRYASFGDLSPTVATGFWTALDVAPVFHLPASAGPHRACFTRDQLDDVRWLSVTDEAAQLSAFDVMLAGVYVDDADGVARSAGRSAPACVAWVPPSSASVTVTGTSLSGHTTTPWLIDHGADRRFELSDPVTDTTVEEVTGDPGASTSPGTNTTWTFVVSDLSGVAVVSKEVPAAVTAAGLTVTVERGTDGAAEAPDTFTANLSLTTSQGTVTATAAGEAVLGADGVWRLRGATTFTGGTWNVASGVGGFTADIHLVDADAQSDDQASWRLDGLVG